MQVSAGDGPTSNVLDFITPPRSLSGLPPRESSLVKAPKVKKRLPEGSYREDDQLFDSCSFLIQWQNYLDDGTISFDIIRRDIKKVRKPLRCVKTLENSSIKRRLFSPITTPLSPDEGVYSDEEDNVCDGLQRKKRLGCKTPSGFTPLQMSDRLISTPEGILRKPSSVRPHQVRPKVLLPGATRASSKTCSSCGTKKTPLWRDSEDGIPYCNACGIRYRKYKTSCSVCRYVPRKEACASGHCCRCGSTLIKC